jgi:hypothetical protein
MTNTVTAIITATHRLLAAFSGIDLSDDRGVEDSSAKMIWIAAAIVIAIAATAFAVTIFGQARDSVPDPVPPAAP